MQCGDTLTTSLINLTLKEIFERCYRNTHAWAKYCINCMHDDRVYIDIAIRDGRDAHVRDIMI